MEGTPLALAQQLLCLQKVRDMCNAWASLRYSFHMVLPRLGSLSLSVMLMASLAAATSARCLHRIVRGECCGCRRAER